MLSKPDPSHHYLRCKRDDGSECTVDLTELEEALADLDDEEEQEIPGDTETLPIDRIENRTRFEWMEEFAHPRAGSDRP